MSPIRDVQMSQDPAEETPTQGKDSKCPSPNEQTQKQDVTLTKQIENQLSASESIKPNNQSEIDAIQKHVEDSLLFLDYDKDSKETNNVPKNMVENIDRSVPTDSLKEIVMENPISEQAENKTEDLEKMDKIQDIGDESSSVVEAQNETNVVSASHIVHLEVSKIASSDENVKETSISVEQVQIITELPKKINKDVENNVLLEQLQLKENIEHEIKSPENVSNNFPILDTIWETPLSVEQLRKESEVAPIQNTSDKGLALNDAQKTSVVSEQIYVNVDSNVQEPSQITHLLENFKGSPPLDIATKETDNVLTKNDALSESQQVQAVQETFLENQISSEHVSENLPENTQIKVLEPLVEDITDSPILESFKEDSKSHENVNDNVQPSEIVLVKASIQESPISAHEIKDLKNMVENVDSEVCLEQSQTAPMQNNYEEPAKLSEHEEEEVASKQKVVWESAIISDNTIETVEKVVEDVNKVDLESSQNADQQEHIEATTSTPEIEKGMKNTEIIYVNTDKTVLIGPSKNDVTQENVEQSAVSSEENPNPKIFNTNTDNNVYESLEIDVTKENDKLSAVASENNLNPKILNKNTDKNLYESLEIDVTEENVEESAVSSEKKLNPKILNTNTDINDDLELTQIVCKQKSLWKSPTSTEQTQKEPERNIENVIYHSKSAYSGALKAVPIQEQEQKRTEKPVENIIYNENSAHSGSLKVVPIQDSDTEIAIIPQNNYEKLTYNTHSAHSGSLKVVPIQDFNDYPPAKRARIENADPAQESVQETVTATNKSSSITEETPMDIDSDNSDTEDTFDTADDGQHYMIRDLIGFTRWCKENGLFEVNKNNCLPRYVNVIKYSKHNKGVLKLAKLPRYFRRTDIRQLIQKYTDYVDVEIAANITFIYIDETSCPSFKTALVKWRDHDMLDTVKAFMLLKKANLYLEGVKLRPSYDTRQKVEWINERPIQKTNRHNWERKSVLTAPKVMSAASAPKSINTCSNMKPFINGRVDFDDPIMYGLNQEFLTRLNVRQPLTTDIFIKNLDSELNDEKLRRIFGIAGTIRDLRKYPNPDDNCLNVRIQYDHPLEAIQAISMFDQIALNDRKITVSMTKGKIKDVIPDGFNAIGPGLCQNGKPMSNIRANIEIAQIKSKCNEEMDKLKHKIAIITNKLRSLKSNQIRIEKDTAVAASQQNTQNAMPVHQEPPKAMAALHQNPHNAGTASQQNPQNAMDAISTAIASSIQNNILGMLGMQPNTLQSFMQNSPNSSAALNWSVPNTDISWTQPTQSNLSADMLNQPGPSYPISGFANVQTASNMQSVSNMQPATNIQAAANVQPSPVDMQLNPNLQVYNPSAYGNMQYGFAQSVYSMQPGSSNMLHGSSNMQPGPSNMPVQYPQSAVAQSDFSNESQLNTVVYPPLPAPVNTNPGAYEAYKQYPVSRFDIPPSIVKPQNSDQNLPADQTVPPVTSCQLDIPLPLEKPQKPVASVKTAFKIKNPNLKPAPVSKTLKPGGIKFNIPSLQTQVKPIPEFIGFGDILSAAKTPEKTTIQAKLMAYSKTTAKGKSPDAEPRINKQIKAMRRYSRSPERARSKSPKYEKPKGMRRYSRSPERARSKSPKCDKYKESRRSRERDDSREKDTKSKNEGTVLFKYLPQSVKLYDLREKMCEVGRLVEACSLGKGIATVTFRNRRDAQTCIDTYNMAKVDGQTIEVRWSNK